MPLILSKVIHEPFLAFSSPGPSSGSLKFRCLLVVFLISLLQGVILGQHDIYVDPLENHGVAFVFNGEINDFGFFYAIDQARIHLQENITVVTDYASNVALDEVSSASALCLQTVSTFYERGFRAMIAPGLFLECFNASAIRYPDAKFLALRFYRGDPDDVPPNLSLAYVRIWETRFLTGLVSGVDSQNKTDLGFVYALDIPEIHLELVSHFMGAKQFNPNIKMFAKQVGGFNNVTLQEIGAKSIFDEYPSVGNMALHVNQAEALKVALQYNKTGVGFFSDMRITVGENVLTSATVNLGPLFAGWVRDVVLLDKPHYINYLGGVWDGSVGLAPFSVSFQFGQNSTRYTTVMTSINYWLNQMSSLGSSPDSEDAIFCGDILTYMGMTPEPGKSCLTGTQLINWEIKQINGLTIDAPATLPTTEIYVRWTSTVAIVFMTISGVTIVLIIGLLILTVFKRNDNRFIHSSPPFMYLLCVGAIISISNVFVIGGARPSKLTCNLAIWLAAIGFNILFSAIFAKAGRLWWIQHKASKAQVVKLKDKVLLLFVLLQLSVPLLTLVIGTILATATSVQVKASERFSFYVLCKITRHQWLFALIAWQELIVLFGLVIAFKTRNFYDELNESRQIALLSYNFLFVTAVVLLLLYLLEPQPFLKYALECVAILWLSGFTILVIFLPKLYTLITGTSWSDTTPSLSGHTRSYTSSVRLSKTAKQTKSNKSRNLPDTTGSSQRRLKSTTCEALSDTPTSTQNDLSAKIYRD